jgi:hypothetical protein
MMKRKQKDIDFELKSHKLSASLVENSIRANASSRIRNPRWTIKASRPRQMLDGMESMMAALQGIGDLSTI